jgi:hypothetical protein
MGASTSLVLTATTHNKDELAIFRLRGVRWGLVSERVHDLLPVKNSPTLLRYSCSAVVCARTIKGDF